MTNSSSAPVIVVEEARLKNTSGGVAAAGVTAQPGGSTTTLHGELARCPLVPPNLGELSIGRWGRIELSTCVSLCVCEEGRFLGGGGWQRYVA